MFVDVFHWHISTWVDLTVMHQKQQGGEMQTAINIYIFMSWYSTRLKHFTTRRREEYKSTRAVTESEMRERGSRGSSKKKKR